MKKTILAIILFIFLTVLTGCMTPSAGQTWSTATPNNSNIQIYLDAERAQGTLDVVNAQMEATAKVERATAAAQTAQAQAQATERAWELVQATMQAADANNTATAQAGTIRLPLPPPLRRAQAKAAVAAPRAATKPPPRPNSKPRKTPCN